MSTRKTLLMFVFAVIIYVGNIQLCFAEVLSIPGYSGSGVQTLADLSSAVKCPTEHWDETVIAVCTKNVFRHSDEEVDLGVWYFQYLDQSGVYVKTSDDGKYVDYCTFRRGGTAKREFARRLREAAEQNG